jgi:hypothetical protein
MTQLANRAALEDHGFWQDGAMRVVSDAKLAAVFGALPAVPRVVVSGNFATPWQSLAVLDKAVPEYRLFALNAQPGVLDRDGVTLESPFVGAGMRHSERLRYLPCRLSLVPNLLKSAMPPDVVLLHTSVPADGTVSLGTEVNILPAAIETVRARGGLIVAQLNPQMPTASATLCCRSLTSISRSRWICRCHRRRIGQILARRRMSRSVRGSPGLCQMLRLFSSGSALSRMLCWPRSRVAAG